MIVLGINEDHNATATLLVDGEAVYAASEERITRIKNDVGYPYQSINEALLATGIKPKDIDFVAISAKHQDPLALKVKRVTRFRVSDYIREMNEHWSKVLIEKKQSDFWDKILLDRRLNDKAGQYYNFDFLKKLPRSRWDTAFDRERINVVVRHLGIDAKKVILVDHHLSHAAYAYFASPIDRSKKTAVVTADGWGDSHNASVYLGRADQLEKILETDRCNLARIYRFVTLLLGMRPYEHEYKVMGLAPYAKEEYWRPVYEIFKETLTVEGIDFKWRQKPTDLYFYFRERFAGMRFDGIAGGLQRWLEELVVSWVTNITRKLGTHQLVYSGGLSLNVKANKELAKIAGVPSFFVPASGGDESSCIGAAYWVTQQMDVSVKPMANVYLGYPILDAQVNELIKKHGLGKKFKIIDNPSDLSIAKMLTAGLVIARCVGRAEFGARALGNRSILADPSKLENVKKLNEKIKQRDFWMPFTPTILDRRANDYLLNPKKLASPFMTIAFETTPLAQKELCAALHPADNTARPQILTREANHSYYKLIEAFEKLTGIGALLNTSFNLHGEPIVRDAEDAWYTFINSGIDGLILNKKLILKK